MFKFEALITKTIRRCKQIIKMNHYHILGNNKSFQRGRMSSYISIGNYSYFLFSFAEGDRYCVIFSNHEIKFHYQKRFQEKKY